MPSQPVRNAIWPRGNAENRHGMRCMTARDAIHNEHGIRYMTARDAIHNEHGMRCMTARDAIHNEHGMRCMTARDTIHNEHGMRYMPMYRIPCVKYRQINCLSIFASGPNLVLNIFLITI